MIDDIIPTIEDAKILLEKANERITLTINEKSYGELSDVEIANCERAKSMVNGLDALKNLLEIGTS